MTKEYIIWLKENAPMIYLFFGWFVSVIEWSGLEPIVLMLLGGSAAVDYFFGVLAAFRTGKFNSRIGTIGFLSKLLGICLIIIISGLLTVIGVKHVMSLTAFFVFMTINDVLSALRHWYTIRTGEVLDEYDAITALIKKLHTTLRKYVEDKLNAFDNFTGRKKP